MAQKVKPVLLALVVLQVLTHQTVVVVQLDHLAPTVLMVSTALLALLALQVIPVLTASTV